MRHVTLITGHVRESPRSEVRDDVIETMTPWLMAGEHPLPVPGGYALYVPTMDRGLVATVMQGATPIATIGVAADDIEADVVWPALVQVQRATGSPVAVRPRPPWVAVALLVASPATMDWLGDFERCLAWAYLEQQK